MTDFVLVVATVAFFAVVWGYVLFCDHLMGETK